MQLRLTIRVIRWKTCDDEEPSTTFIFIQVLSLILKTYSRSQRMPLSNEYLYNPCCNVWTEISTLYLLLIFWTKKKCRTFFCFKHIWSFSIKAFIFANLLVELGQRTFLCHRYILFDCRVPHIRIDYTHVFIFLITNNATNPFFSSPPKRTTQW